MLGKSDRVLFLAAHTQAVMIRNGSEQELLYVVLDDADSLSALLHASVPYVCS